MIEWKMTSPQRMPNTIQPSPSPQTLHTRPEAMEMGTTRSTLMGAWLPLNASAFPAASDGRTL